MEEKKSEEPQAKSEDKKPEEEKKKEPQEIVLKIFMHCEGCAKKIHRCLKGFEGTTSLSYSSVFYHTLVFSTLEILKLVLGLLKM
jgi:hypothetical protein